MDRRVIPASALRFERSAPTAESYRFAADGAPAQIAPGGDSAGAKRMFSGVAYSGDVIPNHWYWGDVVFDLATTKAPPKLPMLMGHDREKIAGFSNGVQIGNDIQVQGQLSSYTPDGQQVAKLSDEGFPWQMSVHIEPGSIEEFGAGQNVTVNGRQFSGPITVFRNSTLREISFTPTGWDPNTSAQAMSRTGAALTTNEGTDTMTPEEIKALQDKAAKFEKDAQDAGAALAAEKALREAAEAKTKEFEKREGEAKAAAREEAIKKLFADTGAKFAEESAKPYRTMDADTFAAICEQMRTAAKVRNADPKLFSEAATGGTEGAGSAEQIADKARVLIHQYAKDGKGVLAVDEAVRMVTRASA